MMNRILCLMALTSVLNGVFTSESVLAESVPRVEPFLVQGRLAEGEQDLTRYLQMDPDDDQARFGLGVLQFLQGVEHLGQSLHRYGAKPRQPALLGSQNSLPILRLPVPDNAKPEKVSYADVRRILDTFGQEMQRAEATLAGIRDPDVKLRLHFGLIQLDLNGSGKTEPGEELWRLYARYVGQRGTMSTQTVESFVIHFDRGDAHWLRGYCHLLTAMTDIALAYDWNRLFDICGHLLFADVDSPQRILKADSTDFIGGILDLVAFIHLIDFQVVEPQRLRSARQHLLTVIQQSRESWAAIEAETDNDHEWVPNANQSSVAPGARVTKEMIDGWRTFLDETQDLLEGRKLIPFWRGDNPKRGVNLSRVFLEPHEFDAILWAQGVGAAPYLEEGTCTDPATWQQLQRVFGGEYSFLRYAVWFN